MLRDDLHLYYDSAPVAKIVVGVAHLHPVMIAMSSGRDRADNGFVEYRRKVAEQRGKLLPGFQLRRDLHLQHGRMLGKDVPAG